MSNKINTLGYFTKRLRDSGYRIDVVYKRYNYLDPRTWTIVIDPGVSSILCTCYVNSPERGDITIELYDGGQFIPGRLKLVTNSIEVVMEKLNSFDIHNKSNWYNTKKEE